MPVLKEWTCKPCSRNFDAIANVCPKCGREATRAFRTPVGINGGLATRNSAKRIDQILEREFKRQGISNFSNRGTVNKVEYAHIRQKFPGVYATPFSGAVTPPIQAHFVRDGFRNPQLGQQLGVRMVEDGQAWTPPADVAGVIARPGGVVGGAPSRLFSRTEIAGRTDDKGNQIA